MLIKHILIVLSLSTLVACAGTDSSQKTDDSAKANGRSDCIFRASIRGYSVLDEMNLIVSGSGRRTYHMTLQRRAFGLRSSWRMGFASTTSRVCAGFDKVVFEGQLDNESIRIAAIRELSPEQHEDLLIRFGKKEPELKRTPAPSDMKGAEVEELDQAADDSSGN